MPEIGLILFDDRVARQWEPFALTRPVGELLFGALKVRERVETVLDLECIGHLTSEHLLGFDEPDSPPVLAIEGLPAKQDLLFLSSRLIPSWQGVQIEWGDEPGPVRVGTEVVGWFAPAGSPRPPTTFLLDPSTSEGDEGHDLGPGRLLEFPWELITSNADQLRRDILALFPEAESPELGAGIHLIGESALIVGANVIIEPGTVFDLSGGPIWLDNGAEISAFSRIAGPAYIGRETKILGGKLSEVSVGPVCRVHGEVESSVILGYSNKSHDGFLGHAYLGSWVNLGALTTNSDLKNNYGSVRVWTPGGEVDTGEQKIGALIGDHVKTAIGTLLNTGTVVGAGANLFGTGMPPSYVPPFSWGIGPGAGEYDLMRFLATTEVVMSRRDIVLSSGQRSLLEAAWSLARGHT